MYMNIEIKNGAKFGLPGFIFSVSRSELPHHRSKIANTIEKPKNTIAKANHCVFLIPLHLLASNSLISLAMLLKTANEIRR